MRASLLNGLVGSVVGFGLLAPSAADAQFRHTSDCDGKKGLAIVGKVKHKKYVVPTICPGGCFGYFRTQWTPWHEACPDGANSELPGYGHMGAVPIALPPATVVPPGTVETAPAPKPNGPTPPKSSPLPMPNVTPPTTPPVDRPKNETRALPPGVIPVKPPVVDIRYPGGSS